MIKPEGIHYRFCQVVDNITASRYGTDAIIRERMASQMALRLAHERVKEIQREFHREYLLDLYVCSPDQFWEVVQEEARRISLGQISLRYEWEPETLR